VEVFDPATTQVTRGTYGTYIFNSRINVFCDVPCGLVDRIDVKEKRTASIFRVKE
jgi:hypothetical protein